MNNKKHTCLYFVISCMDFRFQSSVDKLLESENIHLGDFDRVSVAGGAGNFKSLDEHASISKKLHDTQTAVLIVHEDCGAGAKLEDLPKAAAIAKKYFSDIRCFYLKLDGGIEKISAE